MTSKERFLTALSGGRPDRAPLAYVSALTNGDLQQRTGCFMPEVHTDGPKLFRLCAAAHEVLGFDAVTFIINAFGDLGKDPQMLRRIILGANQKEYTEHFGIGHLIISEKIGMYHMDTIFRPDQNQLSLSQAIAAKMRQRHIVGHRSRSYTGSL